jgi:hypothetical protein
MNTCKTVLQKLHLSDFYIKSKEAVMFFYFWSQQYCSISKGFLKSKNKNPLKRGDLESDESLKIKDIPLSQFRIPLHLEVS